MTTTTQLTPLTDRQREILAWLARYIADHGYSPTVREGQMAFAFDSPNGFVCHLTALAKKGWVQWNKRKARTLRITEGVDLGL